MIRFRGIYRRGGHIQTSQKITTNISNSVKKTIIKAQPLPIFRKKVTFAKGPTLQKSPYSLQFRLLSSNAETISGLKDVSPTRSTNNGIDEQRKLYEHSQSRILGPSSMDQYATRKKDLMQYLQNEIWHDVDRILDRLEILRSSSNSGEISQNTLRDRVEHAFRKRKKWSRSFILGKNRMRLKERQKREKRNVSREDIAETSELKEPKFVQSGSEIAALDTSITVDDQDESEQDDKEGNGPYDDNSSHMQDVVEEQIAEDLEGVDDFGGPSMNSNHVHFESSSPRSLNEISETSSHIVNNDETKAAHTISTEKDRLLAMIEDEDSDGKLSAEIMNDRSQQAKFNLMDLLNDDLPKGGDISEAGESSGREAGPSKERSLLDLLDDDFFPSQDASLQERKIQAQPIHNPISTTASQYQQDGRNTRGKPSLLNLLAEENQSGDSFQGNSKTSPPSSLLDLLGDDQQAIHAPKDSLLSLLDEDESNKNAQLEANSREGSLLEILGEDNVTDQTMSNGADSNESLLDMLDDDDFFNEEEDDIPVPVSSIQRENDSTEVVRSSLVDLIDGDITNAHDGNKSNSLQSLLDDDAQGYNSECAGYESKANDVQGNSLLTLLDDDFDDVDTSFASDEDNGQQNSLQILLDDDDLHMGNNIVDGVNNTDTDDANDDVIEAYSITDAVMRVQSLMSSMRKREWELLRREAQVKAQYGEDEDHEKLMTDLFDEGDETSEVDTDEDDSGVAENRGDEPVDELLQGSKRHIWTLTSDEFNVLLLRVATTTTSDKIEKMLDIYLQMEELRHSGHPDAGPNAETYSILFNVFDRTPGASNLALEICNKMIERVTNDYDNGDETNDFNLVNEETLGIAMRILTRKLNIESAETLMHWSLSGSGQGIRVNPFAFRMMLLLYKSYNQQEKAVKLVENCFEENRNNWRELNAFTMDVVDWPRRNREGSKIPISSYCASIIDILEGYNGFYKPSFRVWRKLLMLSMYATRVESAENWTLVHRCCQALISHRAMSKDRLDDKLLQIGLDVAEKVKDPKMAAEFISYLSESTFPNFTSEEGSTAPTLHNNVSPNTYLRAIKLSVDCGMPSIGDKILTQCSKADLPYKSLGDMYTLVLTGYARNGDVEKAQHLFGQMRTAQLNVREETYAAYIHALGTKNKHDEVISVLDSMIDGSNNDGIRPGISCFTACALSAIQSGNFEDVIKLNDKMRDAGVHPNSTIFQGTLIANARLGNNEGVIKTVESAIGSETPIDARSFLLCTKYLIPDIFNEGGNDIEKIRSFIRKYAEENPQFEDEAMELHKSIKDCIREDKRKPSKMKNEVMLQRLRSSLWKVALSNAIELSKVLDKTRND